MAQGKAWDKEKVFDVLEEYFRLGCSIRKACAYAGIPHSTVAPWIQEDEELRTKITAWQNEINSMARRNLRKAVAKGDIDVSTDWLAKKEKDEFSTKQIKAQEGSAELTLKIDNATNRIQKLFSDSNKSAGIGEGADE